MNEQSNIKQLTQKIFDTILKIKEDFPERYALLSENPISVSYQNGTISATDLEKYLKSLQIQLDTA